MTEAGFIQFQNIAAAVETVLYALCITAFFYPFMAGRKGQKNGKRKMLEKVLVVFWSYAAVYLLGGRVPVPGWFCMAAVAVLLLCAGRALGLERNTVFLLAVLYFGIRDMARLIVESLFYIFSEKLLQGLEEEQMIYRSTAAAYSAAVVLRFIVLPVLLFLISRRLQKGRPKLQAKELRAKELCYLCLMPAAGILFGNMIFRLLFIVKEKVYFQLYEQYPVFLGLVPLVSILFYTGTAATIMSYQEMVRLLEEKNKYFVEQQQIAAIRDRMDEVEQFYGGIRRMKHEMRNHLANIRGLAAAGDYEEMEAYISKMSDTVDSFELGVKTGNPITDVIIGDKRKRAERLGIRFDAAFTYPGSGRYDPYDIGIILNNLLVNALEACGDMAGEERYITLDGRQKKKFFLMEVTNSFEGERFLDDRTHLPVSTKKEDACLHGIGLSAVKQEVEKYRGDLDITMKKNEFCVTVLLQER